MKRTTNPTMIGAGGRRIYRPIIVVSPAAKTSTTHEDIVFGIRNHRTLGSLPFGFVGRRGKKFIVVSTPNLSKTLVMLATEFVNYTQNLALRELNETAVNE